MALTFRITTLGCRVNHAETRELETVLLDRGLSPAPASSPAHLEIVHTCSVTNTAAAKSRSAIRRAGRRGPAVFVTGCYAGTNPAEAADLAGAPERIIPHASDDGSTMAERFGRLVDRWLVTQGTTRERVRAVEPVSSTGDGRIVPLPVILPSRHARGRHVRAEVRIQDGCDAHCTFCVIPRVRPRLRSKRTQDAVTEVTRLVELGHREVVLTGIFLGAYGHHTALRRRQTGLPGGHLAELIDRVAAVPGLARLRLSSLEPGDVSNALLDAMVANQPVVVPHLHLPLQSGSDRVLRMMNRQYSIDAYLDMIERVETRLTVDGVPPAITTDIICGFPGETDADFAETLKVIERVQFLHMHVFPFSPKAGTAAARWTDRFVPIHVARARVRQLIDREEDPHDGLAIRYHRRLLGRALRVVVEQPDPTRPGSMRGRCDRYAMVHVPTRRARGTILEVVATDATPNGVVGREITHAWPLPVMTKPHRRRRPP